MLECSTLEFIHAVVGKGSEIKLVVQCEENAMLDVRLFISGLRSA